MEMARETPSARTGLTVIELLVSITVVAILLAILVPAIQQARSAARLTTCRSHLRQVGAALHSVCESTGKFPTARMEASSGYLRMMPYLDASALAADLLAQRTPTNWMVPVLACPEDPVVWQTMSRGGDASYYFNFGTVLARRTTKNGFSVTETEDLSSSDIQDGLSQTVAMSERLVTPEIAVEAATREGEPRRYFWWTSQRYEPGDESLAVEECFHRRTTTSPQIEGVNVPNYRSLHVGYTHLLPPNQAGCYNGPEATFEHGDLLIPASSLHRGGVNSLLADGSVHLVSDNIDAAIWSALGTRSGAEKFSSPFE